ncbi:hypothetical protein ES708_32328 [subsurface metagenome]
MKRLNDGKGRFDAAVGDVCNRAGSGRLSRGNSADDGGYMACIVGVVMKRWPVRKGEDIFAIMAFGVILFLLLVTEYCP